MKKITVSATIKGGRTVTVTFDEVEGGVRVVETFEMENQNSEELQRSDWQTILNNFKQYVKSN